MRRRLFLRPGHDVLVELLKGSSAWAPASIVVAVSVATAWRGLDLMDESYILRLLANPEASKAAGEPYLFPFIAHPLFRAATEDIGLFRMLGIAFLIVLTLCVTRDLVRMATRHGAGPATHIVTALPTTAAVLLIFTSGVRVLSYRSFALAGLLLTVWGISRVLSGSQMSGGALVGLGGWVTFVGKPTSALALIVVLGCASGALSLWHRKFMICAVFGLVGPGMVTLLMARLSPWGALAYLQDGVKLIALLGDHPSIWQMLGIAPVRLDALMVFGFPLGLVLAIGLWTGAQHHHPVSFWGEGASGIVLLVISVIAAYVAVEILAPGTQGVQIMSLTLLLPTLALVMAYSARKTLLVESRHLAVFVGLLLILPWTFAVGSNVSLPVTMAQASVFWALAIVLVAAIPNAASDGTRSASRLRIAMTAVTCVSGIVLAMAYHDGPDGPQLSRAAVPAPVGAGTLYLRPADAAIAHELRTVAQRHGITETTPVIDVTGMGAGYALMLGGRPLGRAHLYGTWTGGVDSATYALGRVSCRLLAQAWVIYAPDNRSDVSEALLNHGVDVRADFQLAQRFESVHYGGRWTMQVLRPRDPSAMLQSCQIKRDTVAVVQG